MPLDKLKGEFIEDPNLGPNYRVVPPEKYMAMTELTTEVEESYGETGKKAQIVQRPIWEVAKNMAMREFQAAAKKEKIFLGDKLSYDVSVQEYPDNGVVCFLFMAMIKGKEYFTYLPVQLTPDKINSMRLSGDWKDQLNIMN